MNHRGVNYFERASLSEVNVFGLIYRGHAAHADLAGDLVFAADDAAFRPNIPIVKSGAVFRADGGTCRVRRLTCGAVSHDDAKEADL